VAVVAGVKVKGAVVLFCLLFFCPFWERFHRWRNGIATRFEVFCQFLPVSATCVTVFLVVVCSKGEQKQISSAYCFWLNWRMTFW